MELGFWEERRLPIPEYPWQYIIMNDSAIYQFQHQFISMGKDKISQVFLELEKSLRTGIFNYKKPALSKKQYEEMKQHWTPEALEFFKARASKLSAGQKTTSEIAYQAAIATVMEFLPEARQKNSAVVLNSSSQQRRILLDISLSMMMDVAFDASNISSSVKVVAGKKIETRYTLVAGKFRIDCEEAGNADIFIFSLYNELIDKPILIGWKNQAEVRACRRGNKNTDPDNCQWEKMSFHFTYPELNPISDLATQFGLKELPEGILLEQITQLHYLPIPNSELTRMLTMNKSTKAKDDFYKVIGIEDPPATPEPKPQEQSTNSDDWVM